MSSRCCPCSDHRDGSSDAEITSHSGCLRSLTRHSSLKKLALESTLATRSVIEQMAATIAWGCSRAGYWSGSRCLVADWEPLQTNQKSSAAVRERGQKTSSILPTPSSEAGGCSWHWSASYSWRPHWLRNLHQPCLRHFLPCWHHWHLHWRGTTHALDGAIASDSDGRMSAVSSAINHW